VDESVSVTLEVEGEGYLKPSSAPPALKGDWFDSFEPNVTDEVDKRGGVLISKRKVEFPIIPRKPGDWVIEPFNVSWFDPVLGKYNSYITAPVTIKVSPGAARMTPRSGPRKDLGQVKETIRYIKPDKQSLPEAGRLPTSQMWFWIIVLLPIPLAAGAWMYARKRDKLESDTGLQRALAAAKNAEARLAQAEKLEDPAAFAAALDQAARGYLADKWNMPAPSVTRETVIQKLDGHTDLAEGFSDLFEMVEMARYAKMDPERMSGSLQKARELIRTMERRGMER